MNYQHAIYRDVAQLLNEALEVRWTDLDRGQAQRMSQGHPMPMPAVLIGLGDVQWRTATGKQYGDMEMEVSVLLERGQETYVGAEGAAEALGLLEWQDRVYEALEEQHGGCWSGMARTWTMKADWQARHVVLRSRWRCTVVQGRPGKDVALTGVEVGKR